MPSPSSADVSARMSKQRSKDTAPEISVRKLLHARGLRYRVAWPIPGMRRRSVDIAFTRAKVAVFVDGCFWHSCPEHATRPAANETWWSEKLAKNMARDISTNEHLRQAGWRVIRIWEHEDPIEAVDRIVEEVTRSRPEY
ncbi:very short patch repair endonuclease [Nonomuraea fuscirosea]|uniref:very short patch repair endonuclease n=1 Tax=Nonomuraea fuscirosea TaxID=1291556 RepID=UPI00343DACEA